MLVKYYKDPTLTYATRNRYKNLTIQPFAQEEQRSVLLGDGANTSVKTKAANICDYVTIDTTRWFVTSYVYMNGGQVTLLLQRDVTGEKGIDGCYGKIERGYTDSILKNRKELSVNEILKSRRRLIPNTNSYGNYTVDNHDNELWGVMYFVKPTELDPTTGEPYPEKVNINIPAFAPNYVEYPVITDGSKFLSNIVEDVTQQFLWGVVITSDTKKTFYFSSTIAYKYEGSWTYTAKHNMVDPNRVAYGKYTMFNLFDLTNTGSGANGNENTARILFSEVCDGIAKNNIAKQSAGITFPPIPDVTVEAQNYNNVVVKDGSTFYSYSSTQTENESSGNVSYTNLVSYMVSDDVQKVYELPLDDGVIHRLDTQTIIIGSNDSFKWYYQSSNVAYYLKTYTRTTLTNAESGTIVIDTTQQLIDEPYSVMVFPLYNVKIRGNASYDITKKQAFMVFNTVVQYLSGANPYVVDAQVYPYCPTLTGVGSEINGYPFFKISSSSYVHNCYTQLLPYKDVKKEYICRKYRCVSPEQSGKSDFNFYDYVTRFADDPSDPNSQYNFATMDIYVKTALKPFNIVSSAVIIPDINSLIGITYDSDLRGSQPTCNGFEVSLSSNAFQTYQRQNSNYQNTFNLQQNELSVQHETERVNEKTNAVVSSISSAAMGAMGGAALGAAGGNIGKGVGAIAGGAAAGLTVGITQGIQYEQNEKLRAFESDMQKQSFDYAIGTIKALPNSINRISSFNEIILSDFWYVIETYECSPYEIELVDQFIAHYGYGIGVYGFLRNFYKNGWFLRGSIITSPLAPNLHNIIANDLKGGIYYNE